MPISTTATWCSLRIRSSVRGTPISLLKFPSVFSTRYFSASTAAMNSLVLVLPTLPVMPTTFTGSFFR